MRKGGRVGGGSKSGRGGREGGREEGNRAHTHINIFFFFFKSD